MLIIGIDPGSTLTACGFIETEQKEIFYDYKKLDNKKSHDERVYDVYLYIKRLLEKYPVTDVALEGSFYSVNIQSALLLAQVRAAIVVAAMDMGFRVHQYLPKQIKQAVCGYGNASKEQIRFIVEKTLGIKLDNAPLDVSDALAVALTHFYTIR